MELEEAMPTASGVASGAAAGVASDMASGTASGVESERCSQCSYLAAEEAVGNSISTLMPQTSRRCHAYIPLL